MFSVIIPLYNKELYIERAIQSILNQTYQVFEIIVVDDGSTDKSVDIVKQINDKRLKLFSKKNGGVSSARNYGINNATYDFIAFLDADDEWLVDFLESIKMLIEKYPNCGMYASGYYADLNGQRSIIISSVQKGNDFIVKDYCIKPYMICHNSMCIDKKVVNKVGLYNSKLIVGEDIDFKLRIASLYNIAYLNVPKSVYYYGTDNNSFSKKIKLKGVFHFFKWYFYPYKNKYSLFMYATKKIVELFKRAYLPALYKNRMSNNKQKQPV